MGQPGTTIVCDGPASDDVGYLNIGADIMVKGDATNGVCNAMAQGRVMIGGSIGARGLTMTKWNPDYERPELWVLGSVGDTFAEFNCGGIGVVCGIEAKIRKTSWATGPASAWSAAGYTTAAKPTIPTPGPTSRSVARTTSSGSG